MTTINQNEMSLPDLGGKLFSYKIKYNQVEGLTNPDPAQFSGKNVKARYNGNIAEVDWRAVESLGANPLSTPKRYGYAYDGLNRLTAGYYQNPTNAWSKENTESIDYDLNGNISKMYRTSIVENNNIATVIDELNYIYSGNKLTNVHDTKNNPSGYEGGGNTITYDLNGNMENMKDKGISSIAYNHLNLPNKMSILQSGVGLTYLYGANGIKLQKVNSTIECGIIDCYTVNAISDYLDGFQYLSTSTSRGNGGETELLSKSREMSKAMEIQAYALNDTIQPIDPGIHPPIGGGGIVMRLKDNDLSFFPTAEGYYDYKKDQYIYQYKDHLGNVRISFGRNSKGALEITDANDYYPFGMNHLKSGYAFFGQSTYKNYKYQGQELQETGFYSFKWRNYMPDVGRFFNVDPLSEKYAYQSHYNFSENRVIDARELEGLEAVMINKNTMEWRVKVDNKLGKDYSKTLLNDAASILSQNGLKVNIIGDPNAKFTLELGKRVAKNTEDGVSFVNGETDPDGNIYDGTVRSLDNPRTLAHELGHKANLPHIFDEESKVENTSENKKNLMNSGANTIEPLQDTTGTNLTSSQTTDMINHINITNENREKKEKEQLKTNQNANP